MSHYNKVIMIGHMTRDVQLSYTPNQTPVADFGVASNHKYGQKEEVCFVDCRAFGKTAENINKFFAKGKAILVEGRLTFDQWTAQDGSKRSKHRITVESFAFVGDGQKTENPEPQGGGDEQDVTF